MERVSRCQRLLTFLTFARRQGCFAVLKSAILTRVSQVAKTYLMHDYSVYVSLDVPDAVGKLDSFVLHTHG